MKLKSKRGTTCSMTMARHSRVVCAARLLLLLVLLALPAVVQAQFNYTTDNGTITITGYTGPGGAVTIPSAINGLPVTSIGDNAFNNQSSVTSVTIPNSVISIGFQAFSSCTSLSSVTIPSSVTSIEYGAFFWCTNLTAISVDALNPAYSSVDGVLFNQSQTTLIQYPWGKAGSYTIPDSVTSIGDEAFIGCRSLTSVMIPHSVTNIGAFAFAGCTSLTGVTIPNSVTIIEHGTFFGCTSLASITIPDSVTSIGSIPHEPSGAFSDCTSLTGIYFHGNPPSLVLDLLGGANNVIVYYLPGTTGWGATFAGRPTAQWLPESRTSDADFGVRTNQFGFNIRWASDKVVVVEASPNLSNPVWTPVSTNTLTGGSSYFNDPQWTNYPARFYRLRSP